MAYSPYPYGALAQLQGGSSPYNPTGQAYGPSLPAGYTPSGSSATAPGNPKQAYTQKVAQTMAPLAPSPTAGILNGISFMNGSIQNGQYVANTPQQQTQLPPPPQTPVPQTPTQPGSYTGVGDSTNTYDPYNNPQYQSYVSNLAQSQTSALTPQQYNPAIASTLQETHDNASIYKNQLAEIASNPNLSESALTGQNSQALANASNLQNVLNAQLAGYQSQQTQAGVAGQVPLTAANTEAGFLAGQAAPQTLSAGQSLVLPNPSTGTGNVQASVGSFGAGTNSQTGAPFTYSQTGGQINNGGLGSTPPALNGDVVSPTDPYYSTLQTASNLLASNQVGAAQSMMSGMSPAVQAQILRMAQAQGYNANTAAGAAAAQQSNTQIAGTVGVNANAAAYANSVPEVQNLNQALGNVTNLGNMTVQNAQGNNVNPFNFVPGNVTVAKAREMFSSTGQATFDSNITQLQAAIQSLYAQGGGNTPSNITSSINSLANGSLSMAGLQSLLSAAEAEGNVLLTTAKNKAISEYQGTQGNSGSSNGSGVGYSSSGLYNF